MQGKKKGWWHGLLLTLIIAGTLTRFFAGIFDNPIAHLFSDPLRHWDNAVNFFTPGLMGGCDPILYQVYLLVVRSVTNANHLWIGITTGILSSSMPWFYYRAARSFGIEKKGALSYWAAMIWIPSFFAIYRYFMMETLLLPLIGLGLWMTGRALRKRDASSFLIMTLVWILAVLTKAQAIPIAAICWVYALWPLSGKLRLTAASGGIFVALILPNILRSSAILGYVAPLGSGYIARIMHASGATHTQFNLNTGTWRYSSPSCYIEPLEPLNRWRIERGVVETTHTINVDLAEGRKDWESALKAVRRTPVQWWKDEWENIILFLFAPSWPDSGRDYVSGWMNYYFRWLWAPIFFQVIIGNLALFRRKRFHLIPVGTLIMLLPLMLQNSVTMEGRYRKPVEPLLLLNLVWLWSSAAERTFRREDDSSVNERRRLVAGNLSS